MNGQQVPPVDVTFLATKIKESNQQLAQLIEMPQVVASEETEADSFARADFLEITEK